MENTLPFETDLSRLSGDSPQWYLDGYPLFYLPRTRIQSGPTEPPRLASFIADENRIKPTTAYFHIPFCRGLCRFCMIRRGPQQAKSIKRFLDAVHREMELAAASPLAGGIEIHTVTMGGGTPTCLDATDLLGLVQKLEREFPCREKMACSLEASTHTARDEGKLEALIRGFDRISFGVQTFDDALRRSFGMVDGAAQVEETLRLARRAGFANMNIDLMYGLPGQDESHLEAELARALDFGLESYTIYPLVIYPESPLAKRGAQLSPQPSTEHMGRMQDLAAGIMERAGYRRFWLNQYIREDHYRPPAALNMGNYIAFGPGAFGTVHKTSYYNHPDLENYLRDVSRNLLPHQNLCRMEADHWALRKFIFAFLQLKVNWNLFSREEQDMLKNVLSRLGAPDLYSDDGTGLFPTEPGRHHADAFLRALSRLSGGRPVAP